MKKILLLLVSVLSLGIGFGQVFSVSGGGAFPAGWSGTNNVTGQAIDKGTYYLVEAGNPSDVITTASYDLSAFASAEFTLDVASYGSGTHREATIEFSFDGGATFTQTETSTTTTGSSYISGGTFTLNSVTNQVVIRISNSGTTGRGVRLRDLILTGTGVGSTDTEVEFAATTYTVAENGSSIQICANIINESATNATTADVVLTSTGSPHISSYTTQTLTFPAGSATQQCTTVSIADDATCDGNVSYDFELQSVAGGTSAAVGAQNTTQLSVSDDEMTNGTLLFQSFEGAGTWAYTLSTPDCNISGDVWSIESNLSSIDPASDGVNFWGIQDLEGNCGGSGYETISFASTDISTTNNVVISFDYKTQGFEAADNLGYEIWEDGVKVVDLVNLIDNTVPNWVTVSYNVTSGVNDVYLVLKAKQNGGSDYAGFDNITLSGEVCAAACAEPTTDATFHLNSPQSLTETSATLNWTDGDGDSRIVVMKENTALSFVPVDNTTYAANSSFGSGTDVGSSEYVVYNGSLSTVSVTDLTPGTEYYAEIYEYGCTPGSEDYYSAGTVAEDVFMTPSENPASFDEGCTGATTMDLTWTAPANGNYDGYLLVVRQGASPHAVTSLDPSTQTFNLDYTAAPTYGAGGGSSVLYNGTATSASVTGLTAGLSYTFEIFTYSIGTSEFVYSSGTTTSQTINILDVSGEAATGSDMQAEIVWANPAVSCFDEILVVANETSGIDFVPSGNGSAYSANSVYAALDQVVYQGVGTSFTTTGLTNGTTYYFEIFVRQGSDWSQGVEVSVIPNTATIFEAGDMAIVAFNTDNSSTEDEFCFFAFKDITEGTAIDFTDNGFGRVNDGEWGDTEGTVRFTRNSGGTIPAGTVICIQGNGNDDADFEIYNCGVLDDANWSITSLNGPLYDFNFNSSDQVWIMQSGSWVNPSGSHNASYTGNLNYGFTATGWESAHGFANTSGSELPAGMECYNTDLNGVSNADKIKYTGPMTIANQRTWLTRINNTANWTGYSSNANYNSGGSDYIGSCVTFNIDNSTGFAAGMWEGDVDNNWFNCANWQNLRVPNETVDVVIQNTATNEANFTSTNTNADIYENVAECNDLTIQDNIWLEGESNLDSLKVNGDFVIEDDGLLDLNGLSTGAVMVLSGNFTNNDPNDDSFDDDKSTVIFNGDAQQDVTTAHSSSNEDFYDVIVSKDVQTKMNLNSDVEVKNVLTFESGIIKTNGNKVYVSAGNVGDLVGYESPNATGSYVNDRYVEGNLEREISSATSYEFPVGDDFGALGYNPVVLTIASGTGSATGKFVNGDPGTISVNDATQTCSGSPVLIHYSTMTGLGFWNFESATTYSYDVMLHPNSSNTNTDPNSDGQYRALKAASGTAGGTWPVASATDGDFCTVSSNYYAIPGVGYTGFSDFGVGGGISGPALPVELLFFQAENQVENVLVSWATATEINNDFFTVERSNNGLDFVAIGEVQGAGNYSGKLDYQLVDEKPLNGISYYRLKQTDFDGSFEYSKIVSVSRNSEFTVIGDVYPNPSSEILNIPVSMANDETLSIQVFDLTGRIVFNENIQNEAGFSIHKLNISRLLSGTYFINLTTELEVKSFQFIKK